MLYSKSAAIIVVFIFIYLGYSQAQTVNPPIEGDTLRFQYGSCAMYVPGINGRNFRIFKTMKNLPADFMLWLGDSVYYMGKEWKTRKGMIKAQTRQRKAPYLKAFLESRQQFAMWDDHDFGPDNSDGNSPAKALSKEVFKEYWPNQPYPEKSDKGIYFNHKHGDIELFVLDGRFHANHWESIFGEEQLNWLFDALKESTATFKFICSGSQFLSSTRLAESLGRCPKEYNLLMNFLSTEHITGVLFLSGDRHFTELIKIKREDSYPLYDFTSSPLTSPMIHYETTKDNREYGTYRLKSNFGQVSITGSTGNRVCRIELRSRRGKILWYREINESELK